MSTVSENCNMELIPDCWHSFRESTFANIALSFWNKTLFGNKWSCNRITINISAIFCKHKRIKMQSLVSRGHHWRHMVTFSKSCRSSSRDMTRSRSGTTNALHKWRHDCRICSRSPTHAIPPCLLGCRPWRHLWAMNLPEVPGSMCRDCPQVSFFLPCRMNCYRCLFMLIYLFFCIFLLICTVFSEFFCF